MEHSSSQLPYPLGHQPRAAGPLNLTFLAAQGCTFVTGLVNTPSHQARKATTSDKALCDNFSV